MGPLRDKDNILVTDEKQMAEILNSHYCNQFTREDLSSIPRVEEVNRVREQLSTVNITQDGVRKKLQKLKPTSAPGPDRVWSKVLHYIHQVAARRINQRSG